MSTRSIIGRAQGDGFVRGVYVHFDGYPTARGPVLFAIAERIGVANLWAHLDAATAGGWSSLNPDVHVGDPDLDGRGRIVEGIGLQYADTREDWRWDYHGLPLEDNGGAEWAYAIEPGAETLTIYKASWRDGGLSAVAVVRFGDDVDWTTIEERGYR